MRPLSVKWYCDYDRGFWRPWHDLPCKVLGNTLQSQQWKNPELKAKTHNLKWYILLKFQSFRIAVSKHNSLSSVNLNLHDVAIFWWNLTHQVPHLYILPRHLFYLKNQSWRCTYSAAKPPFIARIFLEKHLDVMGSIFSFTSF